MHFTSLDGIDLVLFSRNSISNAENLAHIELEDIQDPEIITLSENISVSDQGPEKVSEEIRIVVGKYIIFSSYDMWLFDFWHWWTYRSKVSITTKII